MSSAPYVSRPAEESATAAHVKIPLVGTDYLCAQFHISRNTLFEWVKIGRIPKGRRYGRKILWRADVIEALLGPGPAIVTESSLGDETAEDRDVPAHRGMRTAAQRRRANQKAARELEKKGI
jgi:hypothetical protein